MRKSDRINDIQSHIKGVFTHSMLYNSSIAVLCKATALVTVLYPPGSLLISFMSRPEVASAIDSLDHNSTALKGRSCIDIEPRQAASD
jgi:hypothetical protein